MKIQGNNPFISKSFNNNLNRLKKPIEPSISDIRSDKVVNAKNDISLNISAIESKINDSQEKISLYQNILEKNNINVTIRRSRGQDIDAACGQLANKPSLN